MSEAFNRETRVSPRRPCPTCGGTDWCVVLANGWTLCQRSESARPCDSTGGWWHWTGPGDDPGDRWRDQVFRIHHTPQTPPAPALDADATDRYFRALLARCPLTESHRAHLHEVRCLSDAEIAHAGFGSLVDTRAVANGLVTDLGPDVRGPGFHREKGVPDLNAWTGLVIPFRDAEGRIVGAQVMPDDDQARAAGKYRWLSSADKRDGTASGSPVHVARPATGDDDGEPVVVEGGMKAIIVAARANRVAIGIAGVANQAGVVEAIRAIGATGAAMAIDHDAATNPAVARAKQALRDRIETAGLRASGVMWPERFKGPDDALNAGVMPTIEISAPVVDVATCPDLRQRYRDLMELHSAVMDMLGNKEMNPAERIVAVMHMKNLAVEEARTEPGTEVHIPIARVADQAGVSESTAALAIKTIESGLVRPAVDEETDPEPIRLFTKTVRWARDDVNRATGEISDKKKAYFSRDERRPLAADLRILAHAVKTERRAHGGRADRNGCPDHPNAPVVVRTTRHCQACNRNLGVVSERVESAAARVNLHDADLVWADGPPPTDPTVEGVNQHHAGLLPTPSVENVLRTVNPATSHNDAPPESVGEAWLRGSLVAGTAPAPARSRPTTDDARADLAAREAAAPKPAVVAAQALLTAATRTTDPDAARRTLDDLGERLGDVATGKGRQPNPRPTSAPPDRYTDLAYGGQP